MRDKILSITKKDVEVQSFRPGGAGGQHRDKTSNAVRVVHRPSGAVGECSESRSWNKNRESAFKRMGESRKMVEWIRKQFPVEQVAKQPRRRYTYRQPRITIEDRILDDK